MKRAPIEVSDHALVRWLERVHGFDMEGYRAVLQAQVQAAADAGATAVQLDGMLYMIRDGVLVTVTPPTNSKGVGGVVCLPRRR